MLQTEYLKLNLPGKEHNVIIGDLTDNFKKIDEGYKYTEDKIKKVEEAIENVDFSELEESIENVLSKLTSHTTNENNPHKVTKHQIGLNNVDNTSDLDKPVSTAVQARLYKMDSSIQNLSYSVDEKLKLKANQSVVDSHINNKSNPHEITKAQIGLENVDNTSDMNKPISTATQAELDNKWGKDELEIGGRNLILDSEWNLSNNHYLTKEFQLSEELIVGETYTMTIYGKLGEDRERFRFLGANDYPVSVPTSFSEVSPGVHVLSFEFRYTRDPEVYNTFHIYATPSSGISESCILRAKLEKGTIATDWTPAPEDVEDKIDILNKELDTVKQSGVKSNKRISDKLNSLKISASDSDSISENVTKFENIPNHGELTKTITTQNGKQIITPGYYLGGEVKAQFNNLVPENIKSRVNVGGVVGNLESPLLLMFNSVKLLQTFTWKNTNITPFAPLISMGADGKGVTFSQYDMIFIVIRCNLKDNFGDLKFGFGEGETYGKSMRIESWVRDTGNRNQGMFMYKTDKDSSVDYTTKSFVVYNDRGYTQPVHVDFEPTEKFKVQKRVNCPVTVTHTHVSSATININSLEIFVYGMNSLS